MGPNEWENVWEPCNLALLVNSSLNDSEILVLGRIVKSDYNGLGWVHLGKYVVFAGSRLEGAGHEKLEEDWKLETGSSNLLVTSNLLVLTY